MLKFTCCDAVKQFAGAKDAQILRGITRGFEKECLRVNPDGKLAMTPHAATLGSKLTHPWITTDYSEALLEFITPPSQDPQFPLLFLRDIHRFTVQQLEAELLWAGSMPCIIGKDEDIPIADYGRSNKGRMKYIYREGLGHRYGRHMQTIAGVHYNWSLPADFWAALADCCSSSNELQAFSSDRYFGLLRNFARYSWLIPYLFGASPALCRSFLQGRKSSLAELFPGTLYSPYATSLRMSDLGYQNNAQSGLHVSVNSLAEYTDALDKAIRTPDPFYQAQGVKEGEHWKQLNANLLQIENEFYAGIRPKRVGKHGERPAKALKLYGVEYVEVRLFDLNPMSAIGVTPDQVLFSDAFLLMCLFRDSPPISPREQAENAENKRRVVMNGRDPELQLLMHNREQSFRGLAHELFEDMRPFAEMLDTAYGTRRYAQCLDALRERIDLPESTPSAQVLDAAREHKGFFPYILSLSAQHKAELLREPLAAPENQKFLDAATRSVAEQAQIEADDNISFEHYLDNYYA